MILVLQFAECGFAAEKNETLILNALLLFYFVVNCVVFLFKSPIYIETVYDTLL